jgi:NitT/TauT family transport system permease protein
VKFLLRSKLPVVLSVIGGLLLWQAVSQFFLPTFLPSPLTLLGIIVSIFSKPSAYLIIGKTLQRVVAGVVFSMFIGTALGLVMGLRRSVANFFDSWVMVLLTFPAISWAFLSVLWFGLSDIAPIFTVVLIVFPYVTMNVWEGTKALDKELTDMAAVFRANRSLLLRKVMVPQLMTYLFSSLRISFALSWKIALVSEAFGAGVGVGKELTYWFQASRADMMLAWGASFMALMVLIEMLVLRRWETQVFAWRQPAAT